jgi:hypothetical protein
MRKKMFLLVLALAAVAGSLTAPRAQAVDGGTHSCRFGCRSCVCNAAGVPIACTNAYC